MTPSYAKNDEKSSPFDPRPSSMISLLAGLANRRRCSKIGMNKGYAVCAGKPAVFVPHGDLFFCRRFISNASEALNWKYISHDSHKAYRVETLLRRES